MMGAYISLQHEVKMQLEFTSQPRMDVNGWMS